MNFSSMTLDFKRVKVVQSQQFGYMAPLLDLAGISFEFSGGDHYSVFFRHLLVSITAMPPGLPVRLCHAFLVCLYGHYIAA